MKAKILILLVGLIISSTMSAQLFKPAVVLKDNPARSDYSYYSWNLTSADTLAGTQDSATFTAWPNKHGFVDFSWFLAIDSTNAASDSLDFSVTSRYKEFEGEDWITDTTYVIDVAAGDVAIKISSRSLLNVDTMPNDTKHKARLVQLLISSEAGDGLGEVDDHATIKKVELKVRE